MSARNPTAIGVASSKPTLALLAAVALLIAALAAIDFFLANVERTELENQAQQAYMKGSRLLRAGEASQAVELLRKAQSLERQNVPYGLVLIEALMAANKIPEAERLMNDILQREPNNGSANLIAARLASKQGKITDAESYYHRAIYGEWPQDAAVHRISSRIELVDFLVATGKKQELLAELLPLEEEAGKNLSIQRRVGRFFLMAGSPSRAADLYQRLIRQSSRDAALYEGLGDAELELGGYHLAHNAFSQAESIEHGQSSLANKLELSHTLAMLDPTPRGLTSKEKFRRSMHVLILAYADLRECVENHTSADTGEAQELLKEAESAVSGKPARNITNELAEELLGLAEKIWQARIKSCGSGTAADEEPLRLIMQKLS